MALSAATLKSALQPIVSPGGFPASTAAAAAAWANAYDSYASAAHDVAGNALVAAHKAAFQAAIATLGGSASSAATAFANAFVAYWTAATFAFATPPSPASACPSIGGTTLWSVALSSVVVAVVPTSLQAALASEFANTAPDAATKAQNLANAFHSATISAVTVLMTGLDTTPPPAGPLPITNSCQVF